MSSVSRIWHYVRKGLELHRQHQIDYVMTYGTNAPGIAGMILKFLTGAKLIPELPNVPHDQYRFTEPNFNASARVKKCLSDVLLHLVIWYSDIVKLLYPGQLDHYRLLKRHSSIIFHDLVPVTYIASASNVEEEKSVLLAGFPWYTKGVDVAIRAFRKIAPQFPDYRLEILGHIPNRAYLDELAGDCQAIHFCKAVSHSEALQRISSCSVYLSASRTEGIARVLIEAMSAKRPVVASAVGGTPHLVCEGDSGLLFPSGDDECLAHQLARVLTDRTFASRLGEAGYCRIKAGFDERAYIENFRRMIELVRCSTNGSSAVADCPTQDRA